jgi:hypothetical protein
LPRPKSGSRNEVGRDGTGDMPGTRPTAVDSRRR